MQRSRLGFCACFWVVAALSGCGTEDPGADGGGAKAGPLLPWAEGNTWTYDVTDADNVKTTKVTTIHAEETIGGTGPNSAATAFRVVTTKGLNGVDETISWQGVLGDAVVRYREQAFGATTDALSLEEHWSPHKLHIDGSAERTATGVTWLESYDETKLEGGTSLTREARDRWTVIAAREVVEVPAGSFEAVVLQKVGGTTKTYWYAWGVGKVKETGGQTEELTSYMVSP